MQTQIKPFLAEILQEIQIFGVVGDDDIGNFFEIKPRNQLFRPVNKAFVAIFE